MAKFRLIFLVIGLILVAGAPLPASAQIIVAVPQREAFYVRLAGRVLARVDGHPIAFATVYNRGSKKGVRTDSSGFFTIVLSNKDTLEIRHVGFRTLFYMKPPGRNGNYYEDIVLSESTFELKEVTIYRRRASLRTIAINPDYDRKDIFNLHPFGDGQRHKLGPAGFGSPVTALYEAFSRREQNNRKLEQLKADREQYDMASIRYNEYYVESLTGLHGQDLAAFMGYCPLQPNFIITSTDYELAAAVLNCYRRFMNDL